MRSSGQKAHSVGYDSQGSLRPYSRSPEAQIVAFAKAGDNVAFAELVQRNYARIFRLAYSITRNFGLAGDAVGEAFYKAFEHLSQFESVGLFSSWLNRIVVNECNETARTNRRAISVEFEEHCTRNFVRSPGIP